MADWKSFNMTSMGDIKLRSAVKFCLRLGESPVETLRMFQESNMLPLCGKTFAYKWHEQFRMGRRSINDNKRSGPPSVVLTSSMIRLKELMNLDRCITVREVAETLDQSSR